MFALSKRLLTVVALIVLGSLSLVAAPASAQHQKRTRHGHKCAKKHPKKRGHKCQKGVGSQPGVGTAANPQPGDLFVAHDSTVTIGTSPTTLLALSNPAGAVVSVEFQGSLSLANTDLAHGRTINCNLMNAGSSSGRAATSVPPAIAGQAIQYQTMQVYATGTAGPEIALVCTAQPAATVAVEVRLTALVLGGIFTGST